MKSCSVPTPSQMETRGVVWMIGAFVFCPCHLPITLSVLALLFGGTAAGVALREHPFVAAAIVTALWVAGTWRGLHLVRAARAVTSSIVPPAPTAAPASASHRDRR